jgi:hypothetical protein
MGDLIVLLLVLLMIAVLLSAIVLPIIALIIAIGSRKRFSRLQTRIEHLEAALASHSIFPATEPKQAVTAEPAPQPVPTPEPPPTQAKVGPPPPIAPPAPSRTIRANELESIIGRRWVGWAAIALILFATAFFLKYAFDNRWIGELGRVTIGVAFGIGMCVAGFRYHRRGWRIFSQILTAGGIVLLYLSSYAAFGYYHLVGQKTAFIYLAILIAEAAALALVYNAPAIAIMALLGGFLNPILLHSGRDPHSGEEAKPLVIVFNDEQYVRQLRLQITDHSNPTLNITSIQASAPARQLVYELKEPISQPLRLYFGNAKVPAPHYDFENELSSRLSTEPTHSTLGNVTANPEYPPEPKPLTERVPWLIYVVLAASSIALGFILLSLARSAMRMKAQPAD